MRKQYPVYGDTRFDEKHNEKDYLNEGEEDQMEVVGYKRWIPYQILTWTGILLSLGLIRLFFFWFPKLYLISTHKKCELGQAEKVLIIDQFEKYKTYFIKTIVEGVIIEKSNREKNYGFTNTGFDNDDNKSKTGPMEMKDPCIKVHFSNGYSTEITEYRLFVVKKLRYIWVEEKGKYLKLSGLGPGSNYQDLHNSVQLDNCLQQHLRKLHGKNEILINVQSYLTLIFIELASPYYFFQLFSIIVWVVDKYLYYTYAIIIISVLSIIITVIQTHKAQLNLRKTVQASDAVRADILTPDGVILETSCSDLVPGDRIVIPDNEEYTLPCDAVLLKGSCIVRESMLTGESVPLTKTALPMSDEEYIEKDCSNHLLFCGTKVIQTRKDEKQKVMALVLRTGFTTAKGDLVRAILYPPPVDYEFEQSIYTFINLSAIGAFTVAVGVAVWMIIKKQKALNVFTKSFELATMVIPAAIPGSLTLSKVYAIQRFKKISIACINPKVINVAGSANCVCFDKTGTITEDGLDVWGVVPSNQGIFLDPNNTPHTLDNDHVKFAMTACHSLSISEKKIIGDPLDARMFESTGWTFEESPSENDSTTSYSPVVYPNLLEKNKLTIYLLHQYQFMSNLQRMSIVTKRSESNFLDLYCKGSPEMIASLSQPQSVPNNLDEVLTGYTKKGYRVLALGWRKLEEYSLESIKKRPRADVEKDFQFLGLLILENKVKPASKPTIEILKRGQFKITMITGDNIQTAISVSRECDIISDDEQLIEIDEQGGQLICIVSKGTREQSTLTEKDIVKLEDGRHRPYKLALTGKAWELVRNHHAEFIPNILVRTAVFARMSSKQKQQVVTELQLLEYCVVMCGDGANDCAALKASNVGVSLSEAEASVASPLSSTKEDISCIPAVIREGRASLVAAFGLIKFILCYGYIQLSTTLISYSFGSNLSDFEFMWEDVFVIMVFSLFFSLTEAYEGEIVPDTPVKKMLHFIPVFSMTINMLIFISFQLLSYYWIQTFNWYIDGPVDQQLQQSNEFMISYTYKNYAIYSISIFQIIMGGIIFSQGYPYRKPLYTNYLYSFFIVLLTTLSLIIIVYPGLWVMQLFVLAVPPMQYRFITLTLIVANFVVCYVIEKVLIEYLLIKKCRKLRLFQNKRKSKFAETLKKTNDIKWLTSIVDAFTYVNYNEKLTVTDYSPAYRDDGQVLKLKSVSHPLGRDQQPRRSGLMRNLFQFGSGVRSFPFLTGENLHSHTHAHTPTQTIDTHTHAHTIDTQTHMECSKDDDFPATIDLLTNVTEVSGNVCNDLKKKT